MKGPYQVVVPKSYKHLQSLALRGEKPNCDCRDVHLSAFGKLVFALFGLAILSTMTMLLGMLSGPHELHDSFLWGLIISVLSLGGLGVWLPGLTDRRWVKTHPDKARELIWEYLGRQIFSMGVSCESRLGPLRLAMERAITNAASKLAFIGRFTDMQGKSENQPTYLMGMQREAEDCLKLQEADKLLVKSTELINKYLGIKQNEIDCFFYSLRDELASKDSATEKELWLQEAREICETLNKVSVRFNQFFYESNVDALGFDEPLSKQGQRAVYAACALLEKVETYYGQQVKAAESAKSVEDKDSEPFVKDGELTRAGLTELEELESGLDK